MRAVEFGLLLFSTEADRVRRAAAAGVAAVVVDWEQAGKRERQLGADTQIGVDTLDDLRRVRRATRGTVICRLNGPGWRPAGEIEAALAAGADELLIPMVRRVGDVRQVLDAVDGRAGVGILVETLDAVRVAGELNRLPLRRVYVGLNDLCIEMGGDSIFSPLATGLIERIRSEFSLPFGFAGLTLPDAGDPLPCRLLLGEMARLGCQFSFLRRSFTRDTADLPLDVAVRRIREGVGAAWTRSQGEVEEDRRQLLEIVRTLERGAERVAS